MPAVRRPEAVPITAWALDPDDFAVEIGQKLAMDGPAETRLSSTKRMPGGRIPAGTAVYGCHGSASSVYDRSLQQRRIREKSRMQEKSG